MCQSRSLDRLGFFIYLKKVVKERETKRFVIQTIERNQVKVVD